MKTALLLLSAALCGGGCAGSALAPGAVGHGGGRPALHRDVAAFDWMVGRWVTADEGATETWTPAGDALFGAAFLVRGGRTEEWEALIVRSDGKGLIYQAMPDGRAPTVFRLGAPEVGAATFSNPEHDFPRFVRYARGPAATLDARVWSDARAIEVHHQRAPLAPAPSLEAADRAFAADTARRGVDGWVDAFAQGGAMGVGSRRVEGRDAIRAAIKDSLAPGRHLDWSPIASGLSPAGDLGFTVGRFHAWRDAPGGSADDARGAYITIWQRDPEGRWRVLFDTGDPEAAAAR